MGLTQSQRGLWERARAPGSGGQAIGLDEGASLYLVRRTAMDLGVLDKLGVGLADVPEFFGGKKPAELKCYDGSAMEEFAALVSLATDADLYFECLAKLQRARLKYERINETQPLPTLDQVGPRALLQYGTVDAEALLALLKWRKWFFDLDNRAGQETGYLFEPVLANAMGGVPISAKQSPIKRASDQAKGRQVDCLKGERAFEFKIRVTIAASGQGRWGEELDFPSDCKDSGYQPVLLVLDPTPNTKLSELVRAFEHAGGEAHTGQDAWAHIEGEAGASMSTFIERYVRRPLEDIGNFDETRIKDITASWNESEVSISIGESTFLINRGG